MFEKKENCHIAFSSLILELIYQGIRNHNFKKSIKIK